MPVPCFRLRVFPLILLFLIAVPAQAQQHFGTAVVVSQDQIFVSEPDNLYRSGAVFVYEKENDQWVQRFELTSPDAEMGDHFGRSAAVDGDRLIVGSTGREGEPGSAYIFERENGTWSHAGTLRREDITSEDRFGRQVALAGDVAFVGAPGGDEDAGAVYVFRRNADGTWAQQGVLEGSATTPGSAFGVAIVSDGRQTIVGAPHQNEETGAAYVFEYDTETNSWTELMMLEGSFGERGDRFGSSLELAGDALLVGSPRFERRIGSVIAYRRNPRTGGWSGTALLLPFAAANSPGFGSALSINGEDVWVGAPLASRLRGEVFQFSLTDGRWRASSRLESAGVEEDDLFGASIDHEGSVGAVGVTGDDFGAGSVAVLERDDTGSWIRTATLRSGSAGLAAITGNRIGCEDGEASLFDCAEVDLLSFLPISRIGGARGVQINDIWGWTDPSTNREYALVGRVDGTAFVDVTDPVNPVYLGSLPLTEGSPGSVWRDVKVYDNHAFIVADNAGEHGMQVFDLTQLRDAGSAPVTFEETARYDRIHSAHNVVINTETGFAYAVGNSGGGETCGGGLHMINIQNPSEPTFAGCYAAEGTGRAGTGYTHDAQCLVYEGPDGQYAGREICFGSNETALNIADVSDKDNPVSIATASYPNVSYAHQGWITEDHRYFYVNDELDELSGNTDETRTLIWDISDLDDPQLIREYTWGSTATDHNLYIRGDLMYQSNYASGLRIHDISDPENPVEVAHFDTMPIGDNGPGFSGSWSNYPFFESGTIAVSSIDEGLFLLRKRMEPGL